MRCPASRELNSNSHRPQWSGPHPGAQLRITAADKHRVTAFATNIKTGGPAIQLPDLELRRRRRARCEDRIRISKDTGLPLQGFAQNPGLVRDRWPWP
mgnify:CR=1 FL=1